MTTHAAVFGGDLTLAGLDTAGVLTLARVDGGGLWVGCLPVTI